MYSLFYYQHRTLKIPREHFYLYLNIPFYIHHPLILLPSNLILAILDKRKSMT